MELSEQSGYKKDFFNGVMKQKDLLPKNFEFRKDSLNFLLKKFGDITASEVLNWSI